MNAAGTNFLYTVNTIPLVQPVEAKSVMSERIHYIHVANQSAKPYISFQGVLVLHTYQCRLC